MTHLLAHTRRNVVPYLALLLVLAVGAGGGYALAASKTKTITVCADKRTGILHLKTHGRCKRTQRRVSWNQQGPQGPQGLQGIQGPQGVEGAQGPAGAPGPAAVSVWADVAGDGRVVAGQGLAVVPVTGTPGTYQVTVTDPTCSREANAPVVSVSDVNPPNGQVGAFPVAWFESTVTNEQFTVFTGVVVGGSFTATNRTFDIHDTCP